jgi:hypothetical protein
MTGPINPDRTLAFAGLLVCLILSGCSVTINRSVLEEQLLEADRAFSDASLEEGPAGDFGYTWGRVVATFPTDDGESITVQGKYMSVWRREASGRWRVVGYMNNRSPSME